MLRDERMFNSVSRSSLGMLCRTEIDGATCKLALFWQWQCLLEQEITSQTNVDALKKSIRSVLARHDVSLTLTVPLPERTSSGLDSGPLKTLGMICEGLGIATWREPDNEMILAVDAERNPRVPGTLDIGFRSSNYPINPLPDASRKDPKTWFPYSLMGTNRSAGTARKRIAKRLIKTGSWEEALADEKMVPVNTYDQEIIIDNCPIYTPPNVEAWRLYGLWSSIQEEWLKAGKPPVGEVILTKGLKWLWVALALLSDSRPTIMNKLCNQMLSGVVSWFEEIVTLMPSLRTEGYFYTSRPSESAFLLQIILLAQYLGWENGLQKVTDSGGEVIQLMLQDGIIERRDGKYQLCEGWNR